mmetsp:Transcript_22868/g.73527  ORF Transcript_22868/g.73527 Transcript_22868/m.73527 type:complete len:127 (-) Transcript_22868:168-548(-)
MPPSLAERFVKSESLEVKMEVLRGLEEEGLDDFERQVQLAQGSSDDMALISSFKDLATTDEKTMKKSGSEAYWHRCTGENDFESSPKDTKALPEAGDSYYWDNVLASNDTQTTRDSSYFDDLSGAC